MSRYVWQDEDWPRLTWRARELEGELSSVAFCHGRFLEMGEDLQGLAGHGFARR